MYTKKIKKKLFAAARNNCFRVKENSTAFVLFLDYLSGKIRLTHFLAQDQSLNLYSTYIE